MIYFQQRSSCSALRLKLNNGLLIILNKYCIWIYELWSLNKESKEDWRSERKRLTTDHFRVTLCICFKRSLELPCASLSKLDWSYLVPQFQKESRVTKCLCFKTRLELPCATVSKGVSSYFVPLFQTEFRVILYLCFKTSLELPCASVSKRVSSYLVPPFQNESWAN